MTVILDVCKLRLNLARSNTLFQKFAQVLKFKYKKETISHEGQGAVCSHKKGWSGGGVFLARKFAALFSVGLGFTVETSRKSRILHFRGRSQILSDF